MKEEKVDKSVSDDMSKTEREEAIQISILTQNVAALTFAVEALNSVVMSVVHSIKDQIEVPDWKTQEDVEKDVGEIVNKCIKKVTEANGPREADKS